MCGLIAQDDSATASGRESAKADPRRLEKVRVIFTSLAKYITAKTIYASNNPNVGNFARAFDEALRAYFEEEKELLLTIGQYQITWHDEVVYSNSRKAESIAFLFYKDGVGEISIRSSVKPNELEQFVDLIRHEIYNPSAHLDIVSKLWQAEFANISYRVFDESVDGASGTGAGSGGEHGEQSLRANDHPILPGADIDGGSKAVRADGSTDSLGTYFNGMVERTHSRSTAHEKERRLQEILEAFYTVGAEELRVWRDEFSSINEGNKLLRFLSVMLDFTRRPSPPAAARDVQDIIERVVKYIAEEADIPTLIALLDIHGEMVRSGDTASDFQSLLGRIKDELTNTAFLLLLGKNAGRAPNRVHELLQYFQLVGKDSVPGVCELLAHVTDSALHNEVCDALIAIAGDDTMRIVDDLNLDNPQEARDAVYLVKRCGKSEIPPIIKKLMSSPDVQVRIDVVDYLAQLGSAEAAQMLCQLLEDNDANVRTQAFAAVEGFNHPLIVDKVTALCFAEDAAAKDADELEHMFRAVGKLAGEKVLGAIAQMIKGRMWFTSAGRRVKHNKLLAITALRYISGAQSLKMLNTLASDRDQLIRTKALYALRQSEANESACSEKQTAIEGASGE